MKKAILGAVCAVGLGLASVSSVYGAPVHETFIYDGYVSADKIEEWSKLPGSRSYLLHLNNPSLEELRGLARLKRVDRLQIESFNYPERTALQEWQALAPLNLQLVVVKAQLPDVEQIALLNEIRFSKIIFILDYIPDPGPVEGMKVLKAPYSVTFAGAAYPKYMDKELMLKFSPNIHLGFAAYAWPTYVQMDLFNALPNPVGIHVMGDFPADNLLEYLQGIQRLESIAVQTDYDPWDAGMWSRMGVQSPQQSLHWISQGRVPEVPVLQAFGASGPNRRITIDQDFDLTEEERALLATLAFPVEWVHTVD